MATAMDEPNFVVPEGFLWGASTAAHQTEGNNTASDWWHLETTTDIFEEASGDAVDSFHRWHEDLELLRQAGFSDYRFSIEWARIEPAEAAFPKRCSPTIER